MARSPLASASCALRRCFAGSEPDSHAISMPMPSSQLCSLRKCCSARISVGAMNATCLPLSIACSAASAATIVLPEPTSPCSRRCIGVARLQIVADLAPDALLRARQLERHAIEQRARQRASARQHGRAARRSRLAMRLERQLLREQFVELEARPCGMRARVERLLRERGQAAAAARAGSAPRRRTSTAAARRTNSSGSDSAVRAASAASARSMTLRSVSCDKAGRGRIDRRQAVGQRRIGRDDLELRMHDLRTEIAVAHVAEHAHARAGRQRLLMARIEREEAQHERRVASLGIPQQAHELAARPILDLRADDDAFRLHRRAGLDVGERHRPACGPRSAAAGAARGPLRAARRGERVFRRGRRPIVRAPWFAPCRALRLSWRSRSYPGRSARAHATSCSSSRPSAAVQ